MNFLNFLRREAGPLTGRLLVAASVSGILNGLLIMILVSAAGTAKQNSEQTHKLLLLVACFGLFVTCRKFVLDRTSQIVEAVICQVRIRIAEKVRGAELLHFEQLGASSVYSVLEGTRTLSESATVITGALSAALLVMLSLLYIALMSTSSFLVIGSLLSVGVMIYVRNARAVRPELFRAFGEERAFFHQVDHLLHGFKELKIDAEKSSALFKEDLGPAALRAERLRVGTAQRFNRNIVFGESFFYALLAVLIFIVPLFTEAPSLDVIAVMLFIIGPVGEIVGGIPALERASAAIGQIEQLEATLGSPPPAPAPVKGPPFESLRCTGLTFKYPEVSGRTAFQVGPLDFEIRRGEVVFIIGGNGSGKSTFLKLLCGLYPASSSTIELNGLPVTPLNIQEYRAEFALVLSDFHLFDRLFHYATLDRARIDELLTAFDLASVTGVRDDGVFENTKLSTGQKKRLALLVTELENRDVIIFDEWAADQDPEFRRRFYHELLGSLAKRGKTVIAATHDDQYFHVADRVLRMTEGKLEPYQDHPPATHT